MLLWKSICSNALLHKTNIVLFLNKIDIMKTKLEAGVQFAEHIVSYGNRPNDVESTSHCESPCPFVRLPMSGCHTKLITDMRCLHSYDRSTTEVCADS